MPDFEQKPKAIALYFDRDRGYPKMYDFEWNKSLLLLTENEILQKWLILSKNQRL